MCHRRPDPALLRRLASDLGATPAVLHRDMRHLLDTGKTCFTSFKLFIIEIEVILISLLFTCS